ncbi:ATP-dependent nuclease [Legionella sp. WA2022007384]
MGEIRKGRLGKLIYVPAISSIDQYTKLSSASSLRDILEILLSSITSNSDAFKQLHKSFKDFSENMTQYENTSEVTLKKFTNQISSELQPWGVGFKIDFIPPDLKFIVKNLIDWHLFDLNRDVNKHGVEMYGSGFQRHFIASLIKTIAEFQHSFTQQKPQELTLNLTLFLFEEPEAYLHPPQQIKLAKDLNDLTNETIMQVIASTHSSHFVSRNTDKLTNLVRIRRDSLYTEVYQIDDDKKLKIFSARQQLEAILGKNELLAEEDKLLIEGIKYFLWLDNERTGIFFSNLVLLVEGLTEASLFRRLIDDGLLDLPEGCGVIQSEGKFNTTRFMLLLEALGINFITIYDEDSDKNLKHKQLNELIKEIHKNNKFSNGLIDITPDLETYLEWPKLDNKSGAHKPAFAILNYEKKRGNIEHLEILCKRIESVITSKIQ